MTADVFEDTVRTLSQARPFQVFVVELHGGTRYEIDHPGALAYRKGMAVFLRPGGGPVVFDFTSVNQVHLGTAADVAGATAAP